MRLLVTGDRRWRDSLYIDTILDNLALYYDIEVVIEGCALGADELAGDHPAKERHQLFVPDGWAKRRKIPGEHYPADWKHLGKGAGPVRNETMLRMGRPDMVAAFHPNIRESKGTRDMVERARAAGVPVYIFPHRDVDLTKIREDGEWWLDTLKSGAVL